MGAGLTARPHGIQPLEGRNYLMSIIFLVTAPVGVVNR
jgi:hypothetical protein